MREVKFGLQPTPTGVAPWGSYCASTPTQYPEEDLGLQRFTRVGGDQKTTSSCVWWALSQSVWNKLGVSGLKQFWASVLGGYFLTRMRSHGGDKARIVDFGCRPTDAAMVVDEVGVLPDSKWPFITSQVDKEPDYGALIASTKGWFSLRRIIAPYGKVQQSIQRIIHVEKSLVLMGHQVDDPYIDWNPGDAPWTLKGRVAGRHMEAIDSYTSKGPLTVSSWGDTYRRQVAWESVEEDDQKEFWFPVINVDLAKKMLGGAK